MKKIAINEEFELEGYVVNFIKDGTSIRLSKLRKVGGKKAVTTNPSLEDVEKHFTDKGYSVKAANDFYNYYNDPDNPNAPWKDGKGVVVKDWKAKARRVWFTDKNKEDNKVAAIEQPVTAKPKGALF